MTRVIALMGRVFNEHDQYIGVKQAGKDTVANLLVQELEEKFECHVLSLAGPLKTMVCNMYGLDQTQMEDQKERPLSELNNFTYRRLLEVMGTDMVRERMGLTTVWIKKLLTSIRSLDVTPAMKCVQSVFDISWVDMLDAYEVPISRLQNMSPAQLVARIEPALMEQLPPAPTRPHVVIVTDVRFPEEYHALRQIGASMVRVSRLLPGSKPADQQHASDQSYPDMVPHVIIHNHETLETLGKNVKEFASYWMRNHRN
jgi:hypothetical protein